MTYRNNFFIVGIFIILIISLILFVLFFKFSDRNEIAKAPLCPDCNVIIVAYDALQAAHVSHLGYEKETTPALDVLAGKGVSFSSAVSAASWTVPSYMSIFTGLYPSEHKVVNKFSTFNEDQKVVSNLNDLSPNVQTLAQVFKANGYATGGFTGDAGVHSQFGYNQGFDAYTDEQAFGSMENSSQHALEWLSGNKDKKFFMFLHGYDSHGQFKVPENYKGRFMPSDYNGQYKGTNEEQRQLREAGLANGSIDLATEDVEFWRGWYDSKIRDADDRFAGFLDEFNKMGIKDKTVIIILSDHGTEFYEHKRFDHGFSLYDELVHVPLVFIVPGISGGKIINNQVSTIDVAPTIFDIIGINPGEQYRSQIRGKSLFECLIAENCESRDVFMETDYRDYTHKRGVRTADGFKFVFTLESGKRELYDLNSDPEEINDIADQNTGKVAILEQKARNVFEPLGQDFSKLWGVGCVPVYGDQCK